MPTSTTAVHASSTQASSTQAADVDGDSDNNDDDYGYGIAADPADRLAVIALVRRYYAAAAADNGTEGCSLIYSLMAEEIPELYGEASGPPALRGGTCAIVMSKLFGLHRGLLITDDESLMIRSVRVKRNRALAILSFRGQPQRDILVHREFGSWKIDELLDSELG